MKYSTTRNNFNFQKVLDTEFEKIKFVAEIMQQKHYAG